MPEGANDAIEPFNIPRHEPSVRYDTNRQAGRPSRLDHTHAPRGPRSISFHFSQESACVSVFAPPPPLSLLLLDQQCKYKPTEFIYFPYQEAEPKSTWFYSQPGKTSPFRSVHRIKLIKSIIVSKHGKEEEEEEEGSHADLHVVPWNPRRAHASWLVGWQWRMMWWPR